MGRVAKSPEMGALPDDHLGQLLGIERCARSECSDRRQHRLPGGVARRETAISTERRPLAAVFVSAERVGREAHAPHPTAHQDEPSSRSRQAPPHVFETGRSDDSVPGSDQARIVEHLEKAGDVARLEIQLFGESVDLAHTDATGLPHRDLAVGRQPNESFGRFQGTCRLVGRRGGDRVGVEACHGLHVDRAEGGGRGEPVGVGREYDLARQLGKTFVGGDEESAAEHPRQRVVLVDTPVEMAGWQPDGGGSLLAQRLEHLVGPVWGPVEEPGQTRRLAHPSGDGAGGGVDRRCVCCHRRREPPPRSLR